MAKLTVVQRRHREESRFRVFVIAALTAALVVGCLISYQLTTQTYSMCVPGEFGSLSCLTVKDVTELRP